MQVFMAPQNVFWKAVSTAPAPVPMKRTGMNLENFREKKKKKNCIERDSNPSILAYKQSTNPLHQPCQPTKHSPFLLIYTENNKLLYYGAILA